MVSVRYCRSMRRLIARFVARRRAWKSAVSLSAAIIIRDHRCDAHAAARRNERQAIGEANWKAFRFWRAVGREIAGRHLKTDQGESGHTREP